MTIRFTSDHKKTKKGFQIKIEYVLTGKKMAITMTILFGRKIIQENFEFTHRFVLPKGSLPLFQR